MSCKVLESVGLNVPDRCAGLGQLDFDEIWQQAADIGQCEFLKRSLLRRRPQQQ